MENGIRDINAWWTWAETLPVGEEPSPSMREEAERYPERARHCIGAWVAGAELTPMARLARAFGAGPALDAAHAQGLAPSHALYVQAEGLVDAADAFGSIASLRGLDLSGAVDSRVGAVIARLPVVELALDTIPEPAALEPVRARLSRLEINLGWSDGKRKGTSLDGLLGSGFDALESLRIGGGGAGEMKSLASLLPRAGEDLPKVRYLDLFETNAKSKAKLVPAMLESDWVASLRGLRVHDAQLPTGHLAQLATIPFQGLEYLGLGALNVRPKVAVALAKAEPLRTVRSLEIAAAVGKKGLGAIVAAWPELTEIAIWDANVDDSELVREFGLEAVVARGGRVEGRRS